MARELNLIVEPPARIGSRTSQVDQALLEAMSKAFNADGYIGDAQTYKTAKEAGNALAQYRRALAAHKSIPEYTIKTRVWGVDAKGDLLNDRDKAGTWRLALKHDPTRTKRQRKQNGSSGS